MSGVLFMRDNNDTIRCILPIKNISNVDLYDDEVEPGHRRIEIKDKYGMKIVLFNNNEEFLKKYAQKIFDNIEPGNNNV